MTTQASKRPVPNSKNTTVIEADWSLSANGSTYHDRTQESSTIIKRLINSSSSVIGIAGRRGVGKSSLALRVLQHCRDKNYFTLLIQSPTSYNPREFLIAVSQRTCDDIIDQMNDRRGQLPTISDRAHTEERRIAYIRYAILALVVALPLVAAIITVKQVYDSNISSLEERVSTQTKKVNTIISALTGELDSLQQALPSPQSTLSATDTTDLNEVRRSLESLRSSLHNLPSPTSFDIGDHMLDFGLRDFAFLESVHEESFQQVRRYLFDLEGMTTELHTLQNQRRQAIDLSAIDRYFTYSLLATPLLCTLVVFASVFLLRHLTRQLRLLEKRGRKEAGLRSEALALAERLSYETTVSTSHEAGLAVLRLSSAFRRAKSLTTRPLSLPELAESYSDFLGKIAEVFTDGVVVCFDELDKIEDPKELDQLLRGIKGILGRENTHFLFTVSDDAISRFSTRRNREQGILESAFEDIILLDRVSFRFAERVLEPMYAGRNRNNVSKLTQIDTKLFWLFGGGVPREIKRYARACLEAEDLTDNWKPIEIWKKLLNTRFEDMKSFSSRIGRDDEMSAHFLSLLYTSETAFDQERSHSREWLRNVTMEWLEQIPELARFSRNNEGLIIDRQSDQGAEQKRECLMFGRQGIEFVLGATSIVSVEKFCTDEEFERLTPELMRIFEHAPSNFIFAWNELSRYIRKIEN